MRSWLAWSVLPVVAAFARPAAADIDGSKVTLTVKFPDAGKAQSMVAADYKVRNESVQRRYLNKAHCECDRGTTATDAERQLFALELAYATAPASTPDDLAVDVYAGTGCDTATVENLALQCTKLGSTTARAISDVPTIFAHQAGLLAPGIMGGEPAACDPASNGKSVYIMSGTAPAFTLHAEPTLIPADLAPPTLPTEMTVSGLEGAVRVSWTGTIEGVDKFVALCTKADGSRALAATAAADAPYDTVASVCGKTLGAVMPATVDGGDENAELPEVLAKLDPTYVCGTAAPGSSSVTIDGLDNAESYWVVVLAVDAYGNYDARYVPRTIAPEESIDFWEDANDENPGIQGGFCVSQVGHGGGAGALLVAGASLLALRRRRRRAGRGATLLVLGLIALSPTAARAQGWDPYWNDVSASADGASADIPQWHLGLRIGPYHPSIDDSFMSDPGPFRRMFGPGYNLVPQLDLHRLWDFSAVQLGVGMSGGYYVKRGHTYKADSSATDPGRPRADATNQFKMVPLSLTGLLRLTALDERWGIPVVPYVRGGLAYNVWWVSTATGKLAVTCDTCEDKALGASAGLVGAVGLSLRAERIDPAGSASMRTGGVEHAGFYAELEKSWVDGFGNAKRLSLGDTTWYAGVDFEF